MSESLKSLKNYKKQLILGPIFKLTEAVFELIVPLFMAYIIDYGISLDSNNNVIGGDMGVILKTGSMIVALGILGLLCSIICQYFASRAGQGFGTELRNKMLKHIFKLPMSEQDKLGSAKLENIMINDINQLQTAVNMFIRLVVRAPFLVVGGIVCAFLINVKVALIFVASLPFFILVLVFVLKASSKRHVKIQASLDVINKSVNEGVTGQRVVRVFNAQDMMINDYKKTNDQLYKDNNNVSKITSLLSPLTFIIVNVATVFIVYFAAKFVDFGELTQGDVFTLVNYMNQILLALIVVSNLVVIFTKAFASLKRTDSLFALKEEESKDYVELGFDKTKPLLSLNKVSFKFDNSLNYILQNITFELNKGESLGIIGGTGSGKSTLCNLISGFFDPSKGKISLYGKDITTLKKEDINNLVSMASQKAYLFTGTVKDNFLMAKNDATDKEIIDCLKLAKAYSFVNKYEDGLDHYLEESGRNLSGGQKQRLSLARTLLKNSDLIILDDVTSALDAITTKQVLLNLEKLNDKAKIIVSQKISAIKNCDKILVIENGKNCGYGTHEELLNSNKAYREIYESQLMKEGDNQ
ncbi:MAG: ABC transporter ATP-binding protein [Bacilli bacterium]|nr:ABC transporter ATP-binding protein [Bacilli bacterium]